MPPEVRPVAEKLPKICIDHHVTNDGSFADVSIVDSKASSTGEIIWRIARWNEWYLDTAIAEALWVAIVTDSGLCDDQRDLYDDNLTIAETPTAS